ncbi:hypothetical protein SHI21_17045 [Bacteriovorax sp. PP10]|uniref:Uncharacterized protein n=1 Tax=Bacteriovorax antarcticus TaxID=3088717 RepID=A0ABU5VY08_9BACT|nr:hypothetical protein [Bacteriovorax sp. PP10]MEA9357941.1 hypothetical protein [Bacteriovorax sp. PP10]
MSGIQTNATRRNASDARNFNSLHRDDYYDVPENSLISLEKITTNYLYQAAV